MCVLSVYTRRATISPELLSRVNRAESHYGASRSVIIRLALHDWLEKHPVPRESIEAPEAAPRIHIDKERPFQDYIKPGMSPKELLDTLQLYEAAQNNQV